jgi:hypothetical protein
MRWLLRTVASAGAFVALGCSDGPTFARRTYEPMLYVVLSHDPNRIGGDSALSGLFASTATPLSLEYRQPDQLTMRRHVDGAPLDWRILSLSGSVRTGGTSVSLPNGGNLELEWVGAPGTLGRRDIAAGDVYDVHVVSGDRVITGSVSIPETPALTLATSGDLVTVHWPRSRGAAVYFVFAETDAAFGTAIRDTFYTLRYDAPRGLVPAAPIITVTAVDSNLWNYLKDTLVFSSGISGAYGVVGATEAASLAIPPNAGASRRPSAVQAVGSSKTMEQPLLSSQSMSSSAVICMLRPTSRRVGASPCAPRRNIARLPRQPPG